MDTPMVETPERVAGTRDEGPAAGEQTESRPADELTPGASQIAGAGDGSQHTIVPTMINEVLVPNLMGVIAHLREEIRRGLEDIRNDVARSHSPWMCANTAARYADCSPSTIHKAATDGLIERYTGLAGPRFRKDEIDKAIVGKKKGRGTTPKPSAPS